MGAGGDGRRILDIVDVQRDSGFGRSFLPCLGMGADCCAPGILDVADAQ